MIELVRLAADLREARRYCKRDPDEAVRQARVCAETLRAGVTEGGPLGWGRLALNLMVGIKFVRSCPELLSNYLFNSACEVEAMATVEESA